MRNLLALLLACLLVVPRIALAETFAGRVVRVLDGDTVSVLTAEKKEIRVRLAEIDAPEKDQPFGMKAKTMLSDLIFAKDVTVVKTGTDRWRRQLGRIYQGQTDVNLEMVKAGGAWAYTEYLKDGALRTAEEAARSSTLGLWALQEDQRVPPWEWRHPEANETPSPSVEHAPTAQHSEPGAFTCAGKRTCKQMASCAEAQFYLHTCGTASLDGDKDGIPCESLCR